MTEIIWERKENWVGSQIEDAFVMLNFEGGEYVSLNSTATDIWNALANPCSAAAIVSDLTARYDVAADACATSVERVLNELQGRGLIQPKS